MRDIGTTAPAAVDRDGQGGGAVPTAAPGTGVRSAHYPMRKLGMAFARTDEQDAYNDYAWAAIAAANMRKGDAFHISRTHVVVESVTNKTIRLRFDDEKSTSFPAEGTKWERLLRDLADQLVCENLGARSILRPPPPRPLIEILRRDPAVHVDANGSVFVRDVTAVREARRV